MTNTEILAYGRRVAEALLDVCAGCGMDSLDEEEVRGSLDDIVASVPPPAATPSGIAEGHEVCPGCGSEIDPEVCGCGSPISHAYDGHSLIPMGCNCLRIPAATPSEQPLSAPTGPGWWWARHLKWQKWEVVFFVDDDEKGPYVAAMGEQDDHEADDFDAWLPLVAPTAQEPK